VLDGTLAAIQDRYGSDTIRLRSENGAAALQGLEGVEKVNDFGKTQEVRVARDHDPHAIMARIMSLTRVTSFELTKPSLHDIFVRIAGPEAEEEDHE
jgi:ABC-2 type transport system ATP-binding protein